MNKKELVETVSKERNLTKKDEIGRASCRERV